MSGLRQRVLTAIVLATALLVVLLALPSVVTTFFVVLIVTCGAWEWSAFLYSERRRPRLAYVVLVVLGLYATWQYSSSPDAFTLLLEVAAVWWIVALGWIMLAPSQGGSVVSAIAGLLVLVPAGVALIRLRIEDNGAWLLLFSLFVIMAADVGAYFAGHRFGRTKLAPKVSPGKSWEGVIAGIIASIIVAIIGASLLDWPVVPVMGLAASAAAFSVVGDLMESLMKRRSGLKDSGQLFPGHGGVLDRFDSLSAGIPIFVLGLTKTGALA
ncbi:MAG: phosphatidate cytidylyltransferase [Gammaproteobacteria bacterium]|nr:phosphatidate cytidylyltransferase [Gammaproteobacteria bacterium]